MEFQNILKLKLMNPSKHFLSFCFLLLLQFQVVGQEPWQLIKDKEGIQVFTRVNTVSSFKEFKATMRIEAGVNEFLAVLYDVEGLTDWAYNIKESKLLDRPDDMSQTYYAVAKAPWPYKDRDGIYLNQISWDNEAKLLLVDIEMLEQDVEVNDDYVRLDGYGYWQVKEVSASEVEVVFQMQVDPGGSIKAWMANMFVSDSPYYTMLGLRGILQKKKYHGKSYDFLHD